MIAAGIVAKYTATINDADNISAVETAVDALKKEISNLKADYLTDAVNEAIKNAQTQIKDYMYLFGYEVDNKTFNLDPKTSITTSFLMAMLSWTL